MMQNPTPSAAGRSSLLMQQVDRVRAELRQSLPSQLAFRTGATYEAFQSGRGIFKLPVWGQAVQISFPEWVATDLEGRQLNPIVQALLVYHFHTSDGSPAAGHYIAFSALQDGRFYAQAFQSYTGDEIYRVFGDDLPRFTTAARQKGGDPHSLGDAGFTFPFLPRLGMAIVYWRGDEDFPSNYQILFDAAASHHLPTDACAIAGSTLTNKLARLPG